MNPEIVIITALPEELEALLKVLPNAIKQPPSLLDTRVYYRCALPVCFGGVQKGTYDITALTLPGYGRVSAATATNDAIARWKPNYVLLVGIAGGIKKNDADLGDLLICEEVVDYELQKLYETETSYRMKVHRCDTRLYIAAQNSTGEEWIESIQTKRPKKGKPKRLDGPVATGDKVVERPSLLKELLGYSPKLIGVEMEAGGAASACFQSASNPGFFMIRGVSDLADADKEDPNVKKWRRYACDVAATFAVNFLKSGPIPVGGDGEADGSIHEILEEFERHTRQTMENSKIKVPGLPETLPRREVSLIEDQLDDRNPVLLIGESGTGKSAIGHLLTLSAKAKNIEVLFFDARRVEHVMDESQLRQFFSLSEPTVKGIARVGARMGIRVIVDQIDSVIGLRSCDVLLSFVTECATMPGVTVVVITRNREASESKLSIKLQSSNFFTIESHRMSEATTRDALSQLGVVDASIQFVNLATNFLNLELIGRIKVEKPNASFNNIEDEIDLWGKFLELLNEEETVGARRYPADQLIADAVQLSQQALRSDDGNFCLELPISYSIKRLESWGIITQAYGRVYRFSHERLQDYFYAWDVSQSGAMPSDIIRDLGKHRANSIIDWVSRLYERSAPDLYVQFLRETLNV